MDRVAFVFASASEKILSGVAPRRRSHVVAVETWAGLGQQVKHQYILRNDPAVVFVGLLTASC